MSMPPALHGTAYLNFLSSHDGFGLRPIEGILSDEEKQSLITRLEKNGSLFTWRSSNGDTKKIYEANITLFSALKMTDDDEEGHHSIDRFIAAHAIMMSLEGVPAVYINSLIGCENDLSAVEATGIKRRINREKFEKQDIDELLEDKTGQHAIVMRAINQILSIRSKQPAFHPNATQFTLQLGQSLFGVWRQSNDREQSIFAITNVTSKSFDLSIQDLNLIDIETWYDIQTGSSIPVTSGVINFKPYQSVWISNKVF
jgi:sucrose phosphorylase